MAGLARICKAFGRMVAVDERGRRVVWVWDYAADKPTIEKDMPKGSRRWKQSELARRVLSGKR